MQLSSKITVMYTSAALNNNKYKPRLSHVFTQSRLAEHLHKLFRNQYSKTISHT